MIKDPVPATFQQTSGYEAVTSGPAPTVGTVPFKPSQSRSLRKSFSHTKAKSDGLQDFRRSTESANVGRPRTAPGVKPIFVGISKPSTPEASKDSRLNDFGIDGAVSRDAWLPAVPPVPPLPKDADKLRGPKHYDILQFAAQQQISRANYNEHIAARNIDLPRQTTGRFEEDVAVRHAALADHQRASYDVMRTSRESLRQNSSTSEKSARTNTARPRSYKASVPDSFNTSIVEPSTEATIAKPRSAQSSMLTLHSRQRSKDQVYQLPSIPQGFAPAEFSLNQSFSGPPRSNSLRDGSLGRSTVGNDGRSQGPHGSLSSIEHDITPQLPPLTAARSDHDAPVFSERTASGRPHSIASQTSRSGPGNVPYAMPTASPQSSRRSSLVMSSASSLRRWKDSSGRTVMDLTDEVADAPAEIVTRALYYELHAEPIPRVTEGTMLADSLSHSASFARPPASRTTSRDQSTPLKLQSPITDAATLANLTIAHQQVAQNPRLLEHSNIESESAIMPLVNNVNNEKSFGAVPENGNILPITETHAGTRKPLSIARDSALPSLDVEEAPFEHHRPGLVVNSEPSAPVLAAYVTPTKARVTFEDPKTRSPRPTTQIYETPESLKSIDFTNPSRAFGVNTRDFAATPIKKPAIERARSSWESGTSQASVATSTTTHSQTAQVFQHISSMQLPAKKVTIKRTPREQKDFDEEKFAQRQAEARAAILRLEKSLQEDFSFPFASLGSTSIKGPVHYRELSLEDGGPTAPTSRFTTIHSSTKSYQNGNDGKKAYGPETTLVAVVGSDKPIFTPALSAAATAPGPTVPSTESTSRGQKRNSVISTISEADGETDHEPVSPLGAAPYPIIPFSASPDRGRSITNRRPTHSRMNSTASHGSGSSAFSLPYRMVPTRGSSMRDSDMPVFPLDDASWE